ncbi:tail-anchored insertion receptor WRB [Brachionus plicatilis]|uniref:Guided entry of tail-anchored proteins factor 1 n=1 Tax=Brachionus plicatilis TaxID=10195 RepID=A0A3M7P1C3_BRAPC|nr:tail-anchored insertion receptor WRB [Brachionus plicatilis]
MAINYWAIFLSFVINLMKRYSSKLCSLILLKVYTKETPEITEYRNQLKCLREEKSSINPMDNFAKYALVDRKINKLVEKLKENKSSTQSDRMKVMMYINVVFTILTVVLSLLLIWSNYSKPIIDFSSLLDKSDLGELNIFFPLNKMLAFPNKNGNNSIGVTAWLLIANRFIDIVLNKINAIKILKD